MKRLSIPIVAVAMTLIAGSYQQTQGSTKIEQKNTDKIGLIDMATVFKDYKKFTAQRKQLKAEIEQKQAVYEPLKKQLVALQNRIQDKDKQFTVDQKSVWEKELISKSADYQAKLKQDEIEFMRREANIYKEIYQEVQLAVKQYSEYFGYSIVLRYSSEGLDKATDPRKILEKMNRLVVYHSSKVDITAPILKHLNEKYEQQANRGATKRRN